MTAPARRAIVRWAIRLTRREWRQHVLVVALLTVAVGAALFGATAASNIAPSHDGRFGLATHRFDVSVDDRATLAQFVADAEEWFGEVAVVGFRHVPVPGSTTMLEIRSQNPSDRLAAPMLAVLDGRLPANPEEVALTDGAARLLDAALGEEADLDGATATVVGVVENPEALDEEFALVVPSPGLTLDAATILLDADDERVDSFRPSTAPEGWSIEPRGQSEKTTAAVGVLVAATVAMLLVALVAAAAFVVIAQRRQRQLGLLAAVGATERNVRTAMIAGGAAVGLVAAVGGALLAFAAWIVSAPALETAVDRRLSRLDIPWWAVAAGAALSVTTAVVAAWWPARTIARLPVMSALSGRPARPRRTRRSAIAALALLAGGIVALTFAIDPSQDRGSVPLALTGVIASTFGLVLLAAPAVRLAGSLARRAPLAIRIALRDLSRHQSRSGAALAATSLGLAIAVCVVVIAAAAEDGAAEGNLSDRQVLVHVGEAGSPGNTPLAMPEVGADQLDELASAVERWAGTLAEPVVVPLQAAVDVTLDDRVDGRLSHPTVLLGIPVDENTNRDSGLVYVATPALLAYFHIDAATIDADTILLTSVAGDVHLTGNVDDTPFRGPVDAVQRIETAPYGSTPTALITARGLELGGWTGVPAGWLVESSAPLTDEQLAAARDIAAPLGLTVEVRDEQAGLATLRSAATAIGVALALAILAMTVGLIRAEAAGDVRTLTAVGASSRTRRAVTASTAGALAVLAVVLGGGAAYAALVAGYTPDTERLSNVPVRHLVTIAVGLPVVASCGAWLLAGRQPRHLSRQPE